MELLYQGSEVAFYHANNLTQADIEEYDLPQFLYKDAQDPNEAPREYDYDDNMIIMFIDVVVADKEPDEYHTESVGMVIQKDAQRIILLGRDTTHYLSDALKESLAQLGEADGLRMQMLTALETIYWRYEEVLNKLDDRRHVFQERFYQKKRVKGSEMDDIWAVSNALLYIAASVANNHDMLKRYFDKHEFKQHGQEHRALTRLEGLDGQVSQMSQLLSSVVSNLSDSYSARNDRNLNWVMQLLTVYTVVLTIPTVISGFYGQNVKRLPFAHEPWGWIFTLILAIVGMLIVAFAFWKRGYFDK